MKQFKLKIKYIPFFLLFMTFCILAPCALLVLCFEHRINRTENIDKNLYDQYNSAISRVASEKLSEYEKIKLISGKWNSNSVEVDVVDAKITELDAVNMARSAINSLYYYNCYPFSFDSSYENWYSWEAKFCKATETAFHTYSAYYWDVKFYRYDTEETHEVIMTESGTLLGITNNIPTQTLEADNRLNDRNAIDYLQLRYMDEENITIYPLETTYANVTNNLSINYNNINPDTMSILSAYGIILNNNSIVASDLYSSTAIENLPEQTEIYILYETIDDNRYTINFIPWQ